MAKDRRKNRDPTQGMARGERIVPYKWRDQWRVQCMAEHKVRVYLAAKLFLATFSATSEYQG
jgi:hypothetical protein